MRTMIKLEILCIHMYEETAVKEQQLQDQLISESLRVFEDNCFAFRNCHRLRVFFLCLAVSKGPIWEGVEGVQLSRRSVDWLLTYWLVTPRADAGMHASTSSTGGKKPAGLLLHPAMYSCTCTKVTKLNAWFDEVAGLCPPNRHHEVAS